MNYTDFYTRRREIKVPTLLSVFLVGLTVFFIAQFFLNTARYSKATKGEVNRVEISNVFPNQATVFWQTDEKKTGWLIYGTSPDNLDRTAQDVKDTTKLKKKYLNHYVSLSNLQTNTRYFFKLIINNKLVEKDDGSPFVFTTLDNKIEINNLKPAYGKIVSQTGRPIENAVVMLFVNDAYTLSALSKNSGEWLIPLNYIINKNTHQLKTLSREEKVQLQILDEDGKSSNIKASLLNLSPLAETVTIGKDYDLLRSNDVLSATSSDVQTSAINITFPREKATIPAGSPLIKGKALPNKMLTVKVSDGQSTTSMQTKADSTGGWQVTLSQALSAGPHKVILQTTDANGNTVTKSRAFTIAKSGERVLGEATDSATVTETPTPEVTVEPTEVVEKTVSPTTPISGANINYLGISSAALVVLGLGLLFLF